MTDRTITITLEGDVPLQAFAESMRLFAGLVNSLSREVAQEEEIVWEIDALQAGSAIATIVGISQNEDSVTRVINAYSRVGTALERNEPIPFSENVARQARNITKQISQDITSVRFQTATSDSVIYGLFDSDKREITKTISFGSVSGKVQTISDRSSLKFVIYDSIFDKPVNCYLIESQKSQMTEVWGRRVIVSGLITRETREGRPISIREIKDIDIIPQVKPGSYRLARGITNWQPGDEPAEAAIRRMRDGED